MADEGGAARQRADGFIERSKALCEIGRWKDGEMQARQAVAADPDYTRARLQLAHIVLTRGDPEEGAQLAKRVLAQEPSSSWALRILGSWHAGYGRHAEAIDCAHEAVRQSDGDGISLLFLSHTLQGAGDLIGARIAAERIVAQFPEWPDGFVRLAQTRHSPEEAVQAYREALRLDPHCDIALAGLAGISGSLAEYRQAVSLAWSALRADPADRARQRLFARSAWVFLGLSRILAPLRSAHQALAEPFGEACASALRATGANVWSRLLFAFKFEIGVLIAWCALLAGMLGASFLPPAIADVAVPLIGLPVMLGIAIPIFVFFRAVAAARRLIDLRIMQRFGRDSVLSWGVRGMVSGFLLFALSVFALLAMPSLAGVWGIALVMSVVLAVQDMARWRDQWRDRRSTLETISTREALAVVASRLAQRFLTPTRLAVFSIALPLIELAVRWRIPRADGKWVFACAFVPILAVVCIAIDAFARGIAHRRHGDATAAQWTRLGRALIDLAWMAALAAALVIVIGPVLDGHPIEAFFPLLLLPLVVGCGFIALLAVRDALAVARGELTGLARRVFGRA